MLGKMEADYVTKLILRFEDAYPETTHPHVAAGVRRMKRQYEQEIRLKQLLNDLEIPLPRQNELLPPLFPLSGLPHQ
jgi:hypothetical protein